LVLWSYMLLCFDQIKLRKYSSIVGASNPETGRIKHDAELLNRIQRRLRNDSQMATEITGKAHRRAYEVFFFH
jgi:hypothetical protein